VEVRIKMRLTSTRTSEASNRDNNSPYLGLIYNVFQLPRDAQNGLAIAVTAPNRGAGTTYIVDALAAELGNYPANRILRLDLAMLANSLRSSEDILQMTESTSHSGVFQMHAKIDGTETEPSAYWHASAEHRKECINRLRERFHYVLFDCQPILASSDVLGIAPLVDGVILVIEANRTTGKQISQAERQIEVAGGLLCGSVLNKQKSSLPDWAQRRL
jgi:protein-tyrosine kinase